MSWLEPSPPKRTPKLRPWKAPSLTEAGVDIAGLSYVVVEEVEGNVAGLSLSPWPGADRRGRLRFPAEDEPAEVTVDIEDFCGFLNDSLGAEVAGFIRFVPPHRGRERPNDRQLRIGTTFAVEVRRQGTHWRKPFGRWITRIYDVTGDARLVAKLASYGALTEHWEREEAEALDLLMPEEGLGE